MSIRCAFLRRKFVPHLEGSLAKREAERLDRHLAGCRACGELFERVRAGHEAGRQFGRLEPESGRRPREFEAIWAKLGPVSGGRARPARAAGRFPQAMTTPLAVRVLLALVLVESVLLLASNWRAIVGPRADVVLSGNIRDLSGFARLDIGEFGSSAAYRIVTEGFVQSVYFDDEERTLHIKLGEGPKKPEPFVICEVRNVAGMTIPKEGSRVRVYGTARYDGQPGRGWHEVNPVIDIAVLKR